MKKLPDHVSCLFCAVSANAQKLKFHLSVPGYVCTTITAGMLLSKTTVIAGAENGRTIYCGSAGQRKAAIYITNYFQNSVAITTAAPLDATTNSSGHAKRPQIVGKGEKK